MLEESVDKIAGKQELTVSKLNKIDFYREANISGVLKI